MKPISIQLYTLRDQVNNDMASVLRRLTSIGYAAVEPAGFHNLTPVEFKKTADDLGLTISSTHSPWAGKDNIQEVVDTLGILGTSFVVTGGGPDLFKDEATVRRTADEYADVTARLAEHGITVTVHNHFWEFEKLDDGRLVFDVFAEHAPNLQFEFDTYWAANFGANDPAALLRTYADRCPLLHVKDGSLIKDGPLYPVGSGKMDIPAVIAAAGDATKWLVVEQDHSETDMWACVETSYAYMTGNGLARGAK